MIRAILASLWLLLSACARPATPSWAAPVPPVHPLILISVDGMRADYLTRGHTPTLAMLAAQGVTSSAMRPSFPSLTYPNHYTLVTGLRPDRHGIVDNRMIDPGLGRFDMAIRSAVEDARWWNAGEPIWITAERAGLPTATLFWPGSEAAIRGLRPRRWLRFDGTMSNADRVARLLNWFDERPRPAFATLYFDSIDHAGHDFGPDSPQLNAALADVDRHIAALLAGLQARDIRANIILVADHGMAPVSNDRRIFLDQLVNPAQVQLVAEGAVASLTPRPGQGAAVRAALLQPAAHMACHAKADLPARLHHGRHQRVPDILCIADPGWTIWMHRPEPDPPLKPLAGMHGYDPADPDMAAAFLAAGPAFRPGVVLPPFDNVDLHPLLLRLLGLPPMATDGDPATLAPALR